MERKIPLSITLTWLTLMCATFWLITLCWPEIVGASVLLVGLFCALWRGVIWIRTKLYEKRLEADLAYFTRGKSRPQPRSEKGQFASPKEATHARLKAELANRKGKK
ncbi:MAG: hypothetical protein QM647_15215 [Asticcacaulis sp.]|uniref:hypothetical protein n=1 Tax=Asticcacaulis sp. TaxID=1872648 RepID=UPI0039E6741B